MSGIGIIVPGTGPGTGPLIPVPLPGVGIDTYVSRYHSARLPAAGQPIVEWPDSGPRGNKLVFSQDRTEDVATVVLAGSEKFAALSHTTAGGQAKLTSVANLDASKDLTIIGVLRNVYAGSGGVPNAVLAAGITRLHRAGNSQWQLSLPDSTFLLGGSNQGWMPFALTLPRANGIGTARLRTDDAVTSDTDQNVGAFVAGPLRLTNALNVAAAGLDVSEVLVYESLLTATEVSTVITALRANWALI